MGRLDNFRIMGSTHSIHGYSSNQSVPPEPTSLVEPTVDLTHTVTYTGLGRDIWTVPFDDITLMFRVGCM
jgi:hypothetical protein